jgi:MFS-type transporter involved in bile tolerance (Atg22 family)
MTTTFVLQITFYSYSWVYLFGPNHVHHNQQRVDERGICHFLTSSLKHVRQTLCEIFQQRREIKWCLIARSLTQASNIGFIAALLSYLSDTLQISSRNLGIATLILLATAIPGNQISMPLSRRLNPLKSLQICLFVLACFGASLSYLVYEPGHETRLFLLTVILGIASGWREPTEKTLWCQLVPKSSSAEMMGLYLFFSQILVWLPPLIFTVLNESANIQIALSSFGVYFFVGSVLSFFMGDYEKALANTKSCDEKIEIEERLGVGIGEITPGLTSLSSKDSEEESNIITKIGEIEKRFDP